MVSRNFADIIIRLFKTNKINLIPTGSYARGNDPVSDIDFITTEPLLKVFKEIVSIQDLKTKDYQVGEKYMTLELRYNKTTFYIDVWYSTKQNLSFAIFSRTGPKSFNIRTRALAKRKGYKLTDDGLYAKIDDKYMKLPYRFKTEKEIFKFLGVTYKEPVDRK